MVLQEKQVVDLGTRIQVGEGVKVSFWHDRWMDEFTLDQLFYSTGCMYAHG
jgi:hypothetical protein